MGCAGSGSHERHSADAAIVHTIMTEEGSSGADSSNKGPWETRDLHKFGLLRMKHMALDMYESMLSACIGWCSQVEYGRLYAHSCR